MKLKNNSKKTLQKVLTTNRFNINNLSLNFCKRNFIYKSSRYYMKIIYKKKEFCHSK